jgi:hypothetical protein
MPEEKLLRLVILFRNVKLDEKSEFFQKINEKLSSSKKLIQTPSINSEPHNLKKIQTSS